MGEIGFYSNASSPRFLDKLRHCLSLCREFSFSVSFVKQSGLSLIMNDLEAALRRGAKGSFIASSYQNFTDIAALESLLRLQKSFPSSFSCHFDYDDFLDGGFHCKGYLFAYDDDCELLIGSSNLTSFALERNVEWDLGASSSFEAYRQAQSEFDSLFESTHPLDEALIRDYAARLASSSFRWDMDFAFGGKNLPSPNPMQQKALSEIRRLRQLGGKKALVIAATGSGKTFLAAFDAYDFLAKRVLFVVHRESILKEAKATFAKLFKDKRTYGLYTGNQTDRDADFLFASNQMLCRHLNEFDHKRFDYIVIDEVHHAAASSYKAIIEHFQPEFLLGLTATPDRMDGQDVYSLFDDNIPYDLNLREAIENGLVVPFHYYGFKDEYLDYSDEGLDGIAKMMADEGNVGFIISKMKEHWPSGKLMALAFVPNVETAERMAGRFSARGFPSIPLTGKSSSMERESAFRRLQDDDDPLSILFCVDILNEGVDIPRVNMVLFLRPTESSTIFIQQLGRGLRKSPGKDHVVVLDFIANSYRRSAFIPLALGALSPAASLDRLYLHEAVESDFASISLPVHIEFDELSKKEILDSLSSFNFQSLRFLKQDFANLKSFLKLSAREYPSQADFLSVEPISSLTHYTAKYHHDYFEFLSAIGQEDLPYFSQDQKDFLRRVSSFLPLVREDEFALLYALLGGPKSIDELAPIGSSHALAVLGNGQEGLVRKTMAKNLLRREHGLYSLDVELTPSFSAWLKDELEYGIGRFKKEFGVFEGPCRLLGHYRPEQVFLALNNDTDFYMSGVNYIKGRLVLFVNLNKDEVENESLRYEDRFLSPSYLQWESATGTTLDNGAGRRLLSTGKAMVFVRKMKKENGVSLPYVYCGQGTLLNPRESHNRAKTLLFDIKLEKPLPSYLYKEFYVDANPA